MDGWNKRIDGEWDIKRIRQRVDEKCNEGRGGEMEGRKITVRES